MAKILFMAEDDPLMARMYEMAFHAENFELEMVSNGEDAISTLEKMEVPPIVILCDVMMPKVNGFDVLKKIKQNDKLKGVPVIMLTNLAGQADAEKALSLGAVMYLVKSQYDPKEIIEKVKEIVSASIRTSDVPDVSVAVKDIESK